MTNFTNTHNALLALRDENIKISQTKTGEAIHQTQRNKIGGTLREALLADLMALFPYSDNPDDIVVYSTAEGIIFEIPNASVRDGITNPNGSGAISLEIGFTVKNLEYNAKDASEAYEITVAEREAKRAEAEAKKRAKIAKDTEARAKRANKGQG